MADACEGLFQLSATLRVDQITNVFEQGQGRPFTGHFSGVGAHDAGTVTGQVDPRHAAASGAVASWQPGAVEGVPGEVAAQQVGQLGFTAQAVGEGHRVTVEGVFAVGVAPFQRLHPAFAVETRQVRALMHGDAVGG
ncbi:hypothetical protein D3C75_987420 [compost metagenome]